MISKCENIVINRTKFSEFEIYDPAVEDVNNLNIVGYIDDGEVKKNVALSYHQIVNSLSTEEGVGPGIFLTSTDLFKESNKDAYFGKIPCGDESNALLIANSAVSLIQIDGISTDCGLNDDTLIIDFVDTNNNFAFGKELYLVLSNLDPRVNIKNIYNTSGGGKPVDVIIKYAKISKGVGASNSEMTPIAVYVGQDGKFFPYAYYPSSTTEEDGGFEDFTAASIEYVKSTVRTAAEKIGDAMTQYTDGEITKIEGDYKAEDIKINEKIDDIINNLNKTQSDLGIVFHIKKFNSLEHLAEEAENMTPNMLSRLIALVKQSDTRDNVYAEYICLNPDKEGETKKFHLLGNSDSVLASDITADTYGSVVLVSNIDENSVNDPKYSTKNEITGAYIAKNGYALSPSALIDLYKKNSEVHNTIDEKEVIFDGKIKDLTSDIEKIFDELALSEDVKSRLDVIEEKINVGDDSASEEIEYLKEIIGLNGCHNGCACACDHDDNCADIDGKCTILCRINENEHDIDVLNQSTISNSTNIREINGSIEKIDERTTTLENLLSVITSEIDENNGKIETRIGTIEYGISDLADLRNAININQINITENSNNIIKNKASINQLEANLATNGTELNLLKQKVGTNSEDITLLKSSVNINANEINSLKSSVSTNTNDITLLKSLINSSGSGSIDTTELLRIIDETKTIALTNKGNIESNTNNISGINTSITQIQSKVDGNSEKIKQVEEATAQNTEDILNIRELFDTNLENLAETVGLHTNEIAYLNERIDNIGSSSSATIESGAFTYTLHRNTPDPSNEMGLTISFKDDIFDNLNLDSSENSKNYVFYVSEVRESKSFNGIDCWSPITPEIYYSKMYSSSTTDTRTTYIKTGLPVNTQLEIILTIIKK